MANRSQRQIQLAEQAAKEARIQALFQAHESGKKSRKEAKRRRREANQAARQTQKQQARLLRKSLFSSVPKAILTHPEALPFFHLVQKYQPHFIRDLSSWKWPKAENLRGSFSKLLRHLFVKYDDLPAFMDRAWINRNEQEILWYLHIAQGHTIRSAPDLPVKVSKNMAIHFRQAPANCTLPMAFRWAQARALHAPETLAKKLIRTQLGQSLEEFEFGGDLIQLLLRDPSHIDLPKLHELVSFLYRYRIAGQELRREDGTLENLPPVDPYFKLKGRSIASLFRLKEKWEALWSAPAESFSLRNFVGIANYSGTLIKQKDKIPVQIVPLISPQELVEEGQRLNHCIRTYTSRCNKGESTIWSLRAFGNSGRTKSFLTIQVNGRSIMEVRGQSNRHPTSEEQALLRSWARNNQLHYFAL
ncbi:MAG: PcfJ domain-containing protein [Bacteroidota bacterium]